MRCVETERQDIASRYSLGLSQDISNGGVRVQCFHQIPLKAEVYVNLECPSADKPIHANGAVVWASPAEHLPGHWVLGISFSDLDAPTQKLINQLVDNARQRDLAAQKQASQAQEAKLEQAQAQEIKTDELTQTPEPEPKSEPESEPESGPESGPDSEPASRPRSENERSALS